MDRICIKPNKLSGNITIPPSKSMGHRAIICAGLANGKSRISHFDYSDDMLATIEAMRAIGSQIECYQNYIDVDGRHVFSNNQFLIDCNESGSTLRFMIPISLVKKSKVQFVGRGQLGKRPLDIYYDIFDQQGIDYTYKENQLDLKIDGALKADQFKIAGNVSSQFISGLLFALPLLKKDSLITLTSSLESKGYIDLTLAMLQHYGIQIDSSNDRNYKIYGNQSYQAVDYHVEGDYSQAGFYLVANALKSQIEIQGLDATSLQGDKEVIEILERMNCVFTKEGYRNKTLETLKATEIDASQCPDVIPVITVAASVAQGTTVIKHAERLRIKECDRLKAITTELNKIGAKIKETNDGLIIQGVSSLKGGVVSSWDDHRIAMSLAIASTICEEELIIERPDCVKKSYPGFWKDFEKLGGKFNGSKLG